MEKRSVERAQVPELSEPPAQRTFQMRAWQVAGALVGKYGGGKETSPRGASTDLSFSGPLDE